MRKRKIENDEGEKSLVRSKKSFISLADILGKEALSFLPGGGLVYELLKIICTHGSQFYNDRREARLREFYRALLDDLKEQDFREFIKKPFSPEDYYTLLSNAIQDDEEAKVTIYSKIFKALIKKSIPDKYKLHFIKSVRELTCYDIQLIREIYIRAKYEFIEEGEGKPVYQVQELLTTDDPIKNISIQTIVRLGFITSQKVDLDVTKYTGLMPTELLDILANIIFDPQELTPESIGKEAWEKFPRIPIIASDISKHQDVLNLLANSLRKVKIKFSLITMPESQQLNLSFFSLPKVIILCLEKEDDMKKDSILRFVNHPLIKEKKFVKVLLSKSSTEEPYDPLPDINAIAKFNFASKDSYEVKEFEEFMKNITLAS